MMKKSSTGDDLDQDKKVEVEFIKVDKTPSKERKENGLTFQNGEESGNDQTQDPQAPQSKDPQNNDPQNNDEEEAEVIQAQFTTPPSESPNNVEGGHNWPAPNSGTNQ